MANELESPGDAPNDVETLSDEQRENAAQKKAAEFLDLIKVREREFEEGWWKTGDAAFEMYCMDDRKKHSEENPYNILYSNTEVLAPSLYSATPKPDVRSRFKGVNLKPLPEMLSRFLTVFADPASPGADTFDSAMTDAVLSSLVPGMGFVRIRYVENRSFPLVAESGHFKTLIWGRSMRWSKTPWIAFKHSMHKDQMFKQFEIPEEDQLTDFIPSSETKGEEALCTVYEFWHKASKKVYFLSEEWKTKQLRVDDDPLELENFYPTPGPLIMTAKPGRLAPTPLYEFYKNQAEELNRVSVRLNKVLSAIRVRGAYNSLLGEDLKKILSSDELENELVPAEEAGLLAQNGGFEKQIWMLPIEKLITVAQELYKAREAIKQVIYEITGISDIIRGSSVASETATAQDLKNKWGTVRLRKMQTLVSNYARDLFRMAVDCGSSKIPPAKWNEIVQMQLPLAAEKAAAQARMQQLAQVAQMQQPIPGQPPAPPQIPEEIQNALQNPSVEELLTKIQNDMNRAFVVNIQTSSTIDLDTAQDKAEVGEFMNAMGQLLAGLTPLTTLGPTGMEAAKAILMAVLQRYKFGIDIADVIAKIQPPPTPQPEKPKGPTPEEEMVIKAEAQLKLQKIQLETQTLNAQASLDQQKLETEKEKLNLEIQLARLRFESQRVKLSQPVTQNAPVRN